MKTPRLLPKLVAAMLAAVLASGCGYQGLNSLPLPPLFLLMFSGLYMFVLPHAARWRSGAAS